MPGLNGYLVQFAALVGASSIPEVADLLPGYLQSHEERSGKSFAGRVAQRRQKMASAS
jgi:hypothetical protein